MRGDESFEKSISEAIKCIDSKRTVISCFQDNYDDDWMYVDTNYGS